MAKMRGVTSMFSDKGVVPNHTQIKKLTPVSEPSQPKTQSTAGRQTVVFIKSQTTTSQQENLLKMAVGHLQNFLIPFDPSDPKRKWRFNVVCYDENLPTSDTNFIPDSCIFYVMNNFESHIIKNLPDKAIIYTPKTVIELVEKGLWTDKKGITRFTPDTQSRYLMSLCMLGQRVAFVEYLVDDFPMTRELEKTVEANMTLCRRMCATFRQKWPKDLWTIAVINVDASNYGSPSYREFFERISKLRNKHLVSYKWIEQCWQISISPDEKDIFFKASTLLEKYAVNVRYSSPTQKSSNTKSDQNATPKLHKFPKNTPHVEKSNQIQPFSSINFATPKSNLFPPQPVVERESLYNDLSKALIQKDSSLWSSGISTQMRLLPEPKIDIEHEPEMPSQQLVWQLNQSLESPTLRRSSRPADSPCVMKPPQETRRR